MKISQGKSGSNHKLRRKIILLIYSNNKTYNIKNITKINDIKNNLKLISDSYMDTNKIINNNSNINWSYNNNSSLRLVMILQAEMEKNIKDNTTNS